VGDSPGENHVPAPGIVCLENTHNAAGGTVLTPGQIDAVAAAGHEAGFAVHLDGARVFNAAVALGVDVRDLTRSVDSVSVCLSKGLSAPVGSLVAGTRAFIDRANRVRRSLGGAMRQAGIIAAPGLVALRTMIPRLRRTTSTPAPSPSAWRGYQGSGWTCRRCRAISSTWTCEAWGLTRRHSRPTCASAACEACRAWGPT